MGSHFWSGVALLLALLALTLGTVWCMKLQLEPAGRALDSAQAAALEGDLPGAAAFARQAEAIWGTCRSAVAAAADQSPMDEIDKLFVQLQVYAQGEEEADFAACCAQLSLLVRGMIQAHAPLWWNFL